MPNETGLVYCAYDQEYTKHTIDVDENGETVLTCDCGRFVKIPASVKPADMKEYLVSHAEANEGQVSREDIDKKKTEVSNALSGTPSDEEDDE